MLPSTSATGGSASTTDRGHHDVELILAEFLQRQIGLVLPGQQHVADAALREGGGRSARAGVQHRHVAVKRADEVLRVLAVLFGPGPGGQIVPARAAAGLGVGRDHLHPFGHQVAPVLDALGVPLAHQEDDGRGIGRRVVRQFRLPVGGQLAGGGDLVDVEASASVTTCASSPSITARAWAPIRRGWPRSWARDCPAPPRRRRRPRSARDTARASGRS
jgi:hypothetical protein